MEGIDRGNSYIRYEYERKRVSWRHGDIGGDEMHVQARVVGFTWGSRVIDGAGLGG